VLGALLAKQAAAPWPDGYKPKVAPPSELPTAQQYLQHLFPRRSDNNPVEPVAVYKGLENARRVGFNPATSRWKPHDDGLGIPTVGYGQTGKIDGSPVQFGATFSNRAVENDLSKRFSAGEARYRSIDPRFDKLPTRFKAVLLSQYLNTGTPYKQLLGAMLSGNVPELLKQYGSAVTVGGVKRPLGPRNDQMLKLLKEQLDSIKAGNCGTPSKSHCRPFANPDPESARAQIGRASCRERVLVRV
jgi:GH24 family phage-related lysozyme (muramidase)